MGSKARPSRNEPANADASAEFPFFGAGDATYFEWAEVHVCFEREPTAGEKQRIKKRVPAPLQDSIKFTGHHLMAASGQFAHVVMAETYPGKGDPKDESQWEGGRFFFASDEQVDAFNADTEQWLREAHTACPILAAYRAEDYESGGTELSSWHKSSMKQRAEVVARLEKLHAREPRLEHMLKGITRM